MILKGGKIDQLSGPSFESFDYDKKSPSMYNLTASLTANGTTVLPTARYKGEDANLVSWEPWVYGQSLVYTVYVVPSVPVFNIETPFGLGHNAVQFTGGNYYACASNTFLNIGSDKDIVIEIIVRNPAWADPWVSKMKNDPTLKGWKFMGAGTGKNAWLRLKNPGVPFDNGPQTSDNLNESWNHYFAFANRTENSTEGSYVFVNGKVTTTANGVNISTAGDLDSALSYFAIGNALDYSPGKGVILYVCIWAQAAWLTEGAAGRTEMGNIAAARYNQLMALEPLRTNGSKIEAHARTTAGAYSKIDKSGNKKLFYSSYNGIRDSSVVDSANIMKRGILLESAATNLILQSETLGSWTYLVQCAISNNTAIAPNDLTVMDGIVANAVDTGHYVSCIRALSADVYCFSCFAKPGNKNWMYMLVNPAGFAIPTAYFDLSTGVVGATANLLGSGIELWTNSVYRCWIVFQGYVTVNHEMRIYAAQDNNDNTFAGDAATVNIHAGLVQLEIGSYPSSYIITTTAAVTRTADSFYYSIGSGIGADEGEIRAKIYLPNSNIISDKHIVSLNAAGSSANSRNLYAEQTSEALVSDCWRAGTNVYGITGSTDIANGTSKEVKSSWDKQSVTEKINNTIDQSANGSYSAPTGIDRVSIGTNAASNKNLDGIINDVRVYPRNKGLR